MSEEVFGVGSTNIVIITTWADQRGPLSELRRGLSKRILRKLHISVCTKVEGVALINKGVTLSAFVY